MLSLCTALLLSALPSTQNPTVKQGLDSYDQLDYDKAAEAFDQALAQPDISSDDKAIASFYGGIVAFDSNHADKAHDLMLQALTLNPKLTLADDASPKLQDFFAKVKKEAAAKPKTSDVPPKQADVTKPPKTKDDTGDLNNNPDNGDNTSLTQKPVFWVGIGVGAAVVVGVVIGIVAASSSHSGGTACSSGSGNGCIDLTVSQGAQ
jgi:tetratricopeptide (TPR) repeat protein